MSLKSQVWRFFLFSFFFYSKKKKNLTHFFMSIYISVLFHFFSKAMFESIENQFRKLFFVKFMRLAVTENRFFRKSFLFDQNFTLLTWKSFYIVVLPSNDFRKKHKRKRESHKKKKSTRTKHTQRKRERTIGVDCDHDHRNCADRRWSRSRSRYQRSAWSRSRSRQSRAKRRSRSRDWDRRDCDRNLTDRDRADLDRDRDLTEKMWSFLGFICVFRNEWYYGSVWIELIVAENLKLKTENTVAK